MDLPLGCLSVSSDHLDIDSARYLALVNPYYWPFPGGPYGAYEGWFCKCEFFDLSPSLDPFNGADILDVFEFARSMGYDWVMFHESGVRHRDLKIHRKFPNGFDEFLFGLALKQDREDWRRETQERLGSLSRGDDPTF